MCRRLESEGGEDALKADRESDCQRFGLKCQYYSNQASRGAGIKLVHDSDPFVKDWNDVVQEQAANTAHKKQERGLELE